MLLHVGCIIAVSEQNPASLNTAVVFQKEMMNERQENVALYRFYSPERCDCVQTLSLKGPIIIYLVGPEGPLVMQVKVICCYTFVFYVNIASREMSKISVFCGFNLVFNCSILQ